jgi:hypothetical protein
LKLIIHLKYYLIFINLLNQNFISLFNVSYFQLQIHIFNASFVILYYFNFIFKLIIILILSFKSIKLNVINFNFQVLHSSIRRDFPNFQSKFKNFLYLFKIIRFLIFIK